MTSTRGGAHRGPEYARPDARPRPCDRRSADRDHPPVCHGPRDPGPAEEFVRAPQTGQPGPQAVHGLQCGPKDAPTECRGREVPARPGMVPAGPGPVRIRAGQGRARRPLPRLHVPPRFEPRQRGVHRGRGRLPPHPALDETPNVACRAVRSQAHERQHHQLLERAGEPPRSPRLERRSPLRFGFVRPSIHRRSRRADPSFVSTVWKETRDRGDKGRSCAGIAVRRVRGR